MSKFRLDIVDELEHAGYTFIELLEENQNHYWFKAISPLAEVVEVRYDIHEKNIHSEGWKY